MHTLPCAAALGLACGLGGCALGKLNALGRSHPPLEGQVDAPGLDGAVTIRRDALGVPHIRAQSELDALYALGFVHAQDRLFQADIVRRLAYGSLSEWLGADLARYDAFVRGLELRRLAEVHLAAQPPEIRDAIDAYTRGVNAGAASLKVLPIEYRLLGAELVPWEPVDAVSSVWVQSWNLAENPHRETGALALRDLDPATLDALFRLEPETPPVDGFWDQLRQTELGRYTPGFEAWNRVMGVHPEASQASNNWVIGPERSADGHPIVANDPHLAQSVPSLWYVVDLAGGDLHVAGATLAGTPFVVIGHNAHLAWGLTNVMADQVDFAILERDGEDGVIVEGRPSALRAVDGSATTDQGTVTERVWWSELGPVVTSLDAAHVLVMRWHAFEVDDQTAGLFSGLNHAASVDEALAAAALPSMVAQNLVVADRDDYAWQVFGSLPVRKAHTGRVPYPGSDPAHGWAGWRTALPGERAPARGYLVTANTRPPGDDGLAIGTSYALGWRHQRIAERVEASEKLDAGAVAALQTDVLDGQARALLPGLLAGVQGTDPPARLCRDLLAGWDHEARADAAGPAVWAVFHRELVREMLTDDLGPEATAIYLRIADPARSVVAHGQERFLQDRAASVDRALGRSCAILERALGPDPATWTWGALHPLALEHPFAARAPKLLRRWNMTAVPFPGSAATVAAAGHGWDPDAMQVGGMASLRVVMPLSDLGRSTLVHPGGQSGQPGSPFYASHYGPFVGGHTLPLLFDDEDVATHTLHTLQLIPTR